MKDLARILAFVTLLQLTLTGKLLAGVTLSETIYPISDSPARARVVDFLTDDYGFLWLATWDGLVRFDGYQTRSFKDYGNDDVHFVNHRLYHLYPADDGGLWCHTYDHHLYHFDTRTYRFSALTPAETDSVMPLLKRDAWRDGHRTRRLLQQLPQPILVQRSPYSGELTPIHSDFSNVYQDPQGNLWSTCHEEGFSMLTPARHSFEFIDHGFNEWVRGILFDAHNRLWVSSRHDKKDRTGCLAIYDSLQQRIGYLSPQGRIVQSQKEVDFGAAIYSIMADSQHRIWLGSRYSGLYILIPADEAGLTYRIVHYTDGGQPGQLHGQAIYDMLEDREGKVWIASFDGSLNLVADTSDPEHLTFVNARSGFSQYPSEKGSRLRDLCLSASDELLIGCDNGIISCTTRFNRPEELHFYRNETGDRPHCLSCNTVMHITQCQDGTLLVGTNGGGLNIVEASTPTFLTDSLSFSHFDSSHREKLSDIIFATHEMPDGQLLILSENSLAYFDRDINLQRLCMEGVGTSEMKPLVLPDGQIWIATHHDLLHFGNKQQNAASHFVPNVLYTDLLIQYADSSRQLLLSPADTLIRLRADERNLTLSFCALDLSDPQRIEYRYRLLDRDTAWTDLGTEHRLHLADLRAGTCRIEVCSTNADGEWCDNAALLCLEIEPRFYERTWFWLLLVAILVTIAFLLRHYWQGMIHRKNRERQEAVEAVRQQADQQLKSAALEADAKLEDAVNQAKMETMKQVLKHTRPKTQEGDSSLSQDDRNFKQQVVQFILDHIKEPDFKVESMAQELNMSRPVFYRRLKQVFGCSPIELVKRQRLQHAQELLATYSHISVSEVAYECGYSSPQYFNRVFREAMQCSPNEFKAQMHDHQPPASS